ncbi:bifunctional DNA-formamidopyrimidine glycosylase/DNA-(apurinic or apyrimidinic site) lyase [Rubrimonas cliftonensis]|uniref:Formamidopyrimidine-DNA glycosylase n=1 Tax=Rubrimonas cliftonensis TaxID=89524 RepID=A0A1H3X250_9RHOB|nr:bifunctional DNA-formamidopyrimidine glycosylase/DNA-(apurinic or apyrimidinic site) lyase [Rubrimonas cliftonensis]SDZ93466.1 DNA-(apurinic or apyrimidinic site) lyase [Rubrimonas cliftonensis]
MPELPEVETVRRGLAPVMEGRRLARVEQNRPDLRWPLPDAFAARLTGRRVLRLGRRSKYLLAELDGDETLIVHLGMSGRMLVEAETVGDFAHAAGRLPAHDHVVFHIEGGPRIAFNDARRFGAMDLWPTAALESHRLLAALGPEPLSNAFHEAHLAARLAGRRTPIKAALLDQRIVAGLGNIYVCEALHRAQVAPARLAGSLSRPRVARLAAAIRETLTAAIEAGGSSLRDFRHADGELGYFQHAFRVYGREGGPCLREGCGGVVGRLVQSARSSFWCPRCQR